MAWDVNARLANAVDVTADANGTGVDIGGASGVLQGVVEFRAWVAAVTGTNPTLDLYIEESDDDSTYYEVCKFAKVNQTTVAWLSATKTTTDQYQQVGIVSRRYLRYRVDIGGTGSPTFNDLTIYARGLGISLQALPSAT